MSTVYDKALQMALPTTLEIEAGTPPTYHRSESDQPPCVLQIVDISEDCYSGVLGYALPISYRPGKAAKGLRIEKYEPAPDDQNNVLFYGASVRSFANTDSDIVTFDHDCSFASQKDLELLGPEVIAGVIEHEVNNMVDLAANAGRMALLAPTTLPNLFMARNLRELYDFRLLSA